MPYQISCQYCIYVVIEGPDYMVGSVSDVWNEKSYNVEVGVCGFHV